MTKQLCNAVDSAPDLSLIDRTLGIHPELHGGSYEQRVRYKERTEPLAVRLGEPAVTFHPRATIVRSINLTAPDPLADRIHHHGGVYDHTGTIVPHSRVLRGPTPDCIVGHAPGHRPTPVEHIAGQAVYGGFVFAHFGHLLVESMSRLWGARLETGGCPIYVQSKNAVLSKPAKRLFELAGLTHAIRVTTHDTSFDSVIVPEPAFVIRRQAHRVFKDLYLRMTARAIGRDWPSISERPLYLSRTGLTNDQRCVVGEAILEDVLRKNGFAIVHPETLDLAEQIRLVNQHRTVVGPLGSALHLLLFSRIGNEVVCLTGGPPNGTYTLCDALNGTHTRYLTVSSRTSPLPHPRQKWWKNPELLDVEGALYELKQLGLVRHIDFDRKALAGLTREYRRRCLLRAFSDAVQWHDRELMDRARSFAHTEFAGDPRLQKRLRSALGTLNEQH